MQYPTLNSRITCFFFFFLLPFFFSTVKESFNEEVELRTRQHQPTRVDEDTSNLCQNAGNGHPRRGGSVSGSTSSGWTGNPRVSPPRGDAGTPAIEADRGNVIDPLSGEGEALQRVQLKTPGQLGGEQVTLTSRVGESQGGSVAETRRLQKTHCETTSIAEAGKLCGDGLRVKPRHYGCEHDAILHIGEECCDKVTPFRYQPLYTMLNTFSVNLSCCIPC